MTARIDMRLVASAWVLLGTACALPGGGTRLLCGDEPCEWQVDEGETESIDTWSTWDDGLALLGAPVRLSLSHNPQDSWPYQESKPPTCYVVSATLDVEPRTKTELMVDVNADGTMDRAFPLDKTGWKRVTHYLHMPDHYESVEFVVRKQKPGRARIALLRVEDRSWQGCPTDPLGLEPQNAGAACRQDADCRSGVCAGGYCSACAGDGACGRGDSCSVDAHCTEGLACGGVTCSACAARGDCPLGSDCSGDQQCDTGICAGNLCSTCASDDDCQEGAECVPSVESIQTPVGVQEVDSPLVCMER